VKDNRAQRAEGKNPGRALVGDGLFMATDSRLSIRVRPSSIKRDRGGRATSAGATREKVPGGRTREVTLDPGA
jgi:hypothetical protein